jgi:hypothetical protein
MQRGRRLGERERERERGQRADSLRRDRTEILQSRFRNTTHFLNLCLVSFLFFLMHFIILAFFFLLFSKFV